MVIAVSVSNSTSAVFPVIILISDLSHSLTPPCRTQNSLFLPENLARLSETFSRAHEVMDAEKNTVLGQNFLHIVLTLTLFFMLYW